MKKNYLFSIKIKDCEKVFKEGFDPGVIAVQGATYNLKPGEDSRPMFLMALSDQAEKLLKETVEVVIEEI